jgi:prepilin-type N-terminal cleavage/methylation domain-containing protein
MALRSRRFGFTLIELLAVMLIIAILLGLVLAAISGVMRTAGRDRAKSEIKGMETALEGYKADNGGYPSPIAGFTSTNDYVNSSPSLAGGLYQGSSSYLFQQLTGGVRTNWNDPLPATGGARIYYSFKQAQLGNASSGATGPIYLKDPFGNSYGYFPGSNANIPFNGTNQYDLWSTASDTSSPPTNIPSWITDWNN